MAYYFMLGAVPLPITPSALNIKTPSLNTTVSLINEGEINIPKDKGLREISFEFLLPTAQQYPFASYHLGGYSAFAITTLLTLWKKTKWSFPFIVVRMTPGGNFSGFTYIKCLIEDFEFKEDAEEYGLDMMCSITLKEYKPFSTKRIKLKDAQDGSRNTLAEIEKTRDDSSKIQDSTIVTSVMDVISSISPFSRSAGFTSVERESILSACRRNGDDALTVLDVNNIKIPDVISDFENVPFLETLDINSNFSYKKSEDANIREHSSLSDILLFGSGGSGYKSPSAREANSKLEIKKLISKIVSV